MYVNSDIRVEYIEGVQKTYLLQSTGDTYEDIFNNAMISEIDENGNVTASYAMIDASDHIMGLAGLKLGEIAGKVFKEYS